MPLMHGAMQDFPLTLDKFLDHAASWHPDAELVTASDSGAHARTGYARLRERSVKTSHVLAGLGVQKGECVATLAWNTQAHVEAWYAIMGMGAVCHTLNPRLTASQLADMAGQSQARVLIASVDLLPLARELAAKAPGIRHLLVIDAGDIASGPGLKPEPLEPMLASASDNEIWGGFEETAPCGLCFTSGTTGAPKGVTYTHRASFLHTLRQLQADAMAISKADSVLMAVPMFHANAWGLTFALPAVGAKMVLPGRHLDGARLAALINAEKVTVAVGIATVWLGVVEHLEATGGQTPSLKRVVVGGAPLPPALMARFERVLGVTVQTSWGMTELSPAGTFASPDDPDRSAEKSGRPSIGVDLLITDADGNALPQQRGSEGHLHVRGASVVARYFGQESSALNADGWFSTGDLARIDTGGNLIITGRAKDLIKSGGEWINPAEIEAVVNQHPGISLAAVIGRADPKWGERPILLVQTSAGNDVSEESLLEPLRGRVAPWWIPDVVIRIDQMPLAPTGKIDKQRLRLDYGNS
ncbi:AMP-binding protein [Glycocaulis sp.]|uniref:AMP-binding protein n=1 Tax=Glycocaulis sp. TaxID=1969725 RepID=UPI003F727939